MNCATFVAAIISPRLEERERACDEEVLMQGAEPQVYAEGILNVCKFYVESPLACVAGVTGSNLKKRIEEIMTHRIARKLNFWEETASRRSEVCGCSGPHRNGHPERTSSTGATAGRGAYTFRSGVREVKQVEGPPRIASSAPGGTLTIINARSILSSWWRTTCRLTARREFPAYQSGPSPKVSTTSTRESKDSSISISKGGCPCVPDRAPRPEPDPPRKTGICRPCAADTPTALDKVGIKMESTKGRVQILVIDHIEWPSYN
jgi:hypothetical protein